MPGESPSQPGWYPDQNGTMRWFDGASWTDHVQPGSGPAGSAAAGSEPTQVQPGSPSPTQAFPQQPGWGGQPPAGPPSGPPGAAPGSPYGAVPQPSFPGGPGPGGPGGYPPPPSSGGSKGLLIILAVVGAIVLIAILAVGSWAIFLRDSDDDSGSDNGGDDSSLPDTTPEDVVEEYVQAVKDGDCEAALALLSEKLIAEEEANCEDEEDFMTDEEFEYVVGEATIDEEAETATVPFEVTAEGFSEEFPIGLVVEDEEWKIDSFEVAEAPSDVVTEATPSVPTDLTDLPTDLSDFPTDLSDFPTDFPSGFPTDPEELESYFETFLSDFITPTG
ncbi:DUF2510 domain-containing protein [Nocardioides bizhenqiangii]|uniref:DUF2510 domain-containing protein n=1 Tax=Nocardioides bizhenqiangii TaxID=3095076 RepID=A0ABZ0ZRE9_9ACTN|nr:MULTISPECIES: DUF2510 domain-containing protein [unclassified Nocardioides]MDZ5619786.1 DUF2510 domain-containing protein [Nocardioides sp. HM23]WQQ26207.1 DUF2510 domain-containing protein [Nocardioides sp. HM61]